MAKIGMLNEGALHAALKQDYLGESGLAEVPFGGFVADVVRDGVIYEVQTSSFSGLGRKMLALADLSPVVLVHPIPHAKHWSGCKTPKAASLRVVARPSAVPSCISCASLCICRKCSSTQICR